MTEILEPVLATPPAPVEVPPGYTGVTNGEGRVIGYQLVADKPTHKTRFVRDELLPQLPDAELLALIHYQGSDAHVIAMRELIKVRNGWFDATSQRYQDTLAALLAEGVISQATHDTYADGIPL